MSRRAFVHRLPATRPDDITMLTHALDQGRIEANHIVAVFGKTEGNGCVNDWTRALATRAVLDCLRQRIGAVATEAVSTVMSGGTEGGLAPHWLIFEVKEDDTPPAAGALAVGVARTGDLAEHDLGRLAQVKSVADGVGEAMRRAGLGDPADVHLVQIKCPLLTSERIAGALRSGMTVATTDTLKSMSLSRAASALGVAVALGELDFDAIRPEAIGADDTLFSTRASASAGVELIDHEIVVLGAAPDGWSGPLRIDHAVMTDGIDIEPVRASLMRLGCEANGQLTPDQRRRLVAMIAKTEPSRTGRIRGSRHTMLVDSDVSPTRHARGFTGGALAGLTGLTELFVSGGAEHQGPDGGGPVAIIVQAE